MTRGWCLGKGRTSLRGQLKEGEGGTAGIVFREMRKEGTGELREGNRRDGNETDKGQSC